MELRKHCTTVEVIEREQITFPAPSTGWGAINIRATVEAMVWVKKAKALRRAAKKRANKSRRANRRK